MYVIPIYHWFQDSESEPSPAENRHELPITMYTWQNIQRYVILFTAVSFSSSRNKKYGELTVGLHRKPYLPYLCSIKSCETAVNNI